MGQGVVATRAQWQRMTGIIIVISGGEDECGGVGVIQRIKRAAGGHGGEGRSDGTVQGRRGAEEAGNAGDNIGGAIYEATYEVLYL